MADPLLIYGAGGFARELLELVRDVNADSPRWNVAGFLSDDPSAKGSAINDLPVLGGREVLHERSRRYHVAFGIGTPAVRQRLFADLRADVLGFPTIIHPNVTRSSFVTFGVGVLVTAGNILTANIAVGNFALINLACTIGHDCQIRDFVTLSPGVNVSGNVRLGEGCDIGTGTVFVQGVSVGEWSVVGAGAVVTRDIPSNCTAVGVPAKVIKERPVGWHLA